MTVLVGGELVLYGFVGDSFFDEGFTAAEVVEALAEVGREEDVTVRLNSGGGYTDDGIASYNALANHRGNVHIIIDAIAASAASIIAMAGDTITMRKGAEMMIHNPSTVTFGDIDDHERSAERLSKVAGLMAEIYAEKTGEDLEVIMADMARETWMDGKEAVARGFATETVENRTATVAAFDYTVYSNAPKKLVARAQKKNWSFAAQARPAAIAAHPQAHAKETPTMATKPTAAAPAPATPAPDAGEITAEDVKGRIKAILNAPEAKAFSSLANHFAFETEMTADSAISALKAAEEDQHGDGKEGPVIDPVVPAPSASSYQERRTAASDLSAPAVASVRKAPNLNPTTVYASRRKKTGA